MFKLGKRSNSRLLGVNPILAFAVTEAIKITKIDFSVFEGVRTKRRQKLLVKRGVSWTMKSRHLSGNAVDLVVYKNNKLSWSIQGHSDYELLAEAMKTVIKRYDLPIEWGKDLWGKDYYHWQIHSKHTTWDIRNYKCPKN